MAWAYLDAQQSIGGTGTSTVNKPVGTTTGTLLVAIQTYSSPTGTGSAPAGFAEVAAAAISNATASSTKRVWWKIATSSEPTNYTFTNSGTVYQDVVLLGYSGGADASPVDAVATATYASVATTGATLPSVTTTAAGDLLVASITGPSTPTWTPTAPLVTRVSGSSDGDDVVDTTIAAAGSSGSLVDSPSTAQSNVIATVVTFKAAASGVNNTRTVAATISHTTTVARASTKPRAVAATVPFPSVTVARATTVVRPVAVTTAPTATLARTKTSPRTLSASQSHAATMTRAQTLSRPLAATATHTATVARFGTRSRALSATASHSTATTGTGSKLRTLAATVAHTATLVRSQSVARTLVASATHGVTVARNFTGVRALSATATHTAALARAFTFVRALTASITPTVSVARVASGVRTLAATVAHSATVVRVGGSTVRALSATVAHAATVARSQRLTRALNWVGSLSVVVGRNSTTLTGTVMRTVQGPYGDILVIADSSLATYTAQGYAEVAPPYITIASPNPAWEVGPTYRITHTDGRSYAVTYASYQQYYAPLGFTIGRGERGEPTPQ